MMKREDLKKLQDTELKILVAVADLCEKHGINYFLDCGTLLGAIRHDGFIPWDDDTDIAMPYPDYCRFLEIAQKELGVNYFLQTYETDKHYFRTYSKIRLNSTRVVPPEWAHWDIHHGAWVDIFPFFFADSEKDIKKKQRIYKFCDFLQKQNFYRSCMIHDGRTVKNTVHYLMLLMLCVIPMKVRQKLHRKLLAYVFSEKDGRYLCRCGLWVRKHEASSFIGPACYHSFEGLSFRVPIDYDHVLRTDYGDYMQLPPEDKRGNHGDLMINL